MVISPQEAEKHVREKEKPALEVLEKRIDEELKRRFYDNNKIAVRIDRSNVSRKGIEKLMRSYRRASWYVTHQSDQRDGDYLQFEAPKDGYQGRRPYE